MIIENYNCTDIKYSNEKELKVKDNLKLKNDKAGIVEIMAMLEVVIKSNVDHVDIYVCFTPAEEIGITPIVKPIRGGTDGVLISYMGIPCPNIGTGSHNFHSVYEYTSL